MTTTHFISFKKYQPANEPIRVEFALTFAVKAATREEAQRIAVKEIARRLRGYRLQGAN